MLSIPGVGEALFSITSSPTNEEYLEFSIKKCGCVTDWLHAMEPGQQVTLRGPYGNGFPVDTVELVPDVAAMGRDKSLQLARDLQMAIAEYAPGAQVVADQPVYPPDAGKKRGFLLGKGVLLLSVPPLRPAQFYQGACYTGGPGVRVLSPDH